MVMKSDFSLARLRHVVFLASLLAVAAIVAARHSAISRTRAALEEALAHVADVDKKIVAAELALNAEHQTAKEHIVATSQALAQLADKETELSKVDPDSAWSSPPDEWPEWNEKSPFVWLRKEMLSKLPVEPFTKDAELPVAVANVLALDKDAHQALNADLRRIINDYHEFEMGFVQRIDNPLPGIAGDGPSATVRVNPLPEEISRFKQEFVQTLTGAVGEQRADLLLQAGEGWLDSQFGQSGGEPKTISVVRHPDGTYSMAMRHGSSWFSTSGFSNLDAYIPKHLLSFFSDVMNGAGSGDP